MVVRGPWPNHPSHPPGAGIINISSVIGEKGNIGQANYAAAKSGLFGLTNSLALKTARNGITVNSVAPG
jgi:NAD(P)-dependent dehydrogenase (short-subunit alcohol dehydrogenase family)